MKFRRNAICGCGSGKKYKHCHGSVGARPTGQQEPPADWVQMMLARHEAENRQREQQQGLGLPIVSFEANGYRTVAVGMHVFSSKKWKTFHDFLRDYPTLIFGEPWLSKQRRKAPEEQHPFLKWMRQAFDDHKRLGTKSNSPITSVPATPAIFSAMSFAYNLFLIRHNLPSTNFTEQLHDRLVKRLRMPDHFFGALYETYAIALFAIAGFTIELEDESDRLITHCEFVATSKSGRTYSVECKSRNRDAASIDLSDENQLVRETNGLMKKFNDALSKHAAHDRVVFLDIDLPTITQEDQLRALADFIVPKFRELELTLAIDGRPAPPAYVFVTNMPDHRITNKDSYGLMAFAFGFKIPDFGYSVVYQGMHELLKSRRNHADILSLNQALRVRNKIPSTFDGSNPVFTYSSDSGPRLKIGNWYFVPNENGISTKAQLCQGVVLENEKQAYCIYKDEEGQHFLVTQLLTDNEIEAYRLHPATFFGVIDRNIRPKIESVVDLFDFFFETYQNTSKEKLLEFLASAPDYAELVHRSQRDLAILYCERMALVLDARKRNLG